MQRIIRWTVGSISGRVWVHWDTPVLLLDEPTTFLDIGYQLEVLELVQQLNRERGMTIVLVLHDLNQAARYADRMVVLNQGAIVADGTPHGVLTTDLLAAVFNVRANIISDPASGTPICLPFAVAAGIPDTANILQNGNRPKVLEHTAHDPAIRIHES